MPRKDGSDAVVRWCYGVGVRVAGGTSGAQEYTAPLLAVAACAGMLDARVHNDQGCQLEAIFGQRAVQASGWDGRRPGGRRHHSPYPSVSSFSLHLLLGGAVCAVPGSAWAYSRGARYACLLRAQVWLWTGGATVDADGYADG